MNLLFDQNISQRILKILPDNFSSCKHVRLIGLENASDIKIFEYAKNNNLAIVTFDADFVDLNALQGAPPKIIYLNTGNLTTKNVAQLLSDNAIRISDYLAVETDEILELIRA